MGGMILVAMLSPINELILTLSLGSKIRSFWCSIIKGKRTHHIKNRWYVLVNYPMIENLSEAVTNVACLGKDFPNLFFLKKSTRKAIATECKESQVSKCP